MDPIIQTTNQAVDPVFKFIIGICILLFIVISTVMLVFTFRYHRSRSPKPTSVADGNIWLEILWTFIPTLLVMAMFYYGWAGYLALRNVPGNALEVTATARMWSWSFSYPNAKTSRKMYVPAGRPILVNLVSQDVIHGFYIPAFRVKRDVVPGMKNHVWFIAPQKGSYDLFCSVYCGTEHSKMLATVEAVSEQEFNDWLNQVESHHEKISGRKLLETLGCLGCHSLDGTAGVGPTFKGLWGSKQIVLTNGKERSVIVDEEYVRRSILDPKADIVKGYQPIMPVNSDLRENEIEELVEFIQEIGGHSK
ncbi:cytochrome c oxidase subunit 2 [Geobacter sp. OR-1]|uniref:cytochrome c oxidase subunit II n=1 Tax=Geobacter sp. OR-1 TaxID=1266765 RepID=UPI00054364A0|nr:cytochrome c oxidase subunit II [Geobacter sp. OR-1]GAM11638.1 cytochrome c oxidase subunit 2 [Geobacter sp. OR-1]